jgi:hypothetical protein
VSSRIRRPETLTLHISRGDWLLVKKHLTAGESRQVLSRMMTLGATGPNIDPVLVGLSKMATYLLDWSITDADDKPIAIRDQPYETVTAALDALDYDSYLEIKDAIEAHEEAMTALREQEKKHRDGAHISSATSPSADVLVGASSMSKTSIEMSAASSSTS